MAEPHHIPVLLEESLEFLNVRPGGMIVDATLGFGGHSSAIARRLGGAGRLICFDRDEVAMARAKARLDALAEELGAEMPTIEYVARPFSEIAEVVKPGTLDGLLADFGVSSMQLDEAHRGFSFRADGPLDMRMDPRSELTAEQVVNQADEEDLANLIYEFGEERRYCAGAADYDNSRTCSRGIGLRPANKRREDTSGNTDLPGLTDSSER
jgi:16S rRNA (cytosine1402-N4)-methyltransferase